MIEANPFKYECPFCGFKLKSKDPDAQRYEHDQKFHPGYWALQTGISKLEDRK